MTNVLKDYEGAIIILVLGLAILGMLSVRCKQIDSQCRNYSNIALTY